MSAPFTLQLDTNPTTAPPLYRQIVDGLRTALVSGAFVEGEQLPTVRELAVELGVHHNTVAEAYRVLAEEGWLDLARRRGATVCKRPVTMPDARTEENFSQRLRALVAEGIALGVPRAHVERTLLMIVSGLKES